MGMRLGQLNRSEKELTQKLQRQPTEQELADDLGIHVATIRRYRSYNFDAVSLDDLMIQSPTEPSQDNMINQLLQTEWLHAALARGLAQLPQRQADVLKWRFGFDGAVPLSLEQIATKLNITKQRVLQIQKQAMAKLLTVQPSLQDFIR